jgi:hypothetical protein
MITLLLSALLVSGPESDVIPPRIGIPPTSESARFLASDGETFLAAYQADAHPFVAQLARDGTPHGTTMVPGVAGHAIAIASDGERYLALVQPPEEPAAVLLLNADGSVIREVMEISPFLYNAQRSVLWSGSDYVVAWRSEATVYSARISRDGALLQPPFEVAQRAKHSPLLAMVRGEVVLATVTAPDDADEVHLFSIGSASATPAEVLKPGRPFIADIIPSGEGLLMLLRESIPGTAVLNLYRLEAGQPPQITASFADGEWTTPALLELPDGSLIYGSRESLIVAQRLAPNGSVIAPPAAIFDTRLHLPSLLQAATNGAVIVFLWSDLLGEPDGGLDPVVATIDLALAEARGGDGIPDGVLMVRGASSRTSPRVAVAGETSLTVWQEVLEGRTWIGGAVDGRELRVADLEFGGEADVASDGERFLVAWSDGLAIRARVIDRTGSMTDVITVTEARAFRPRVAAGGGHFLVVWEDPDRSVFNSRYGSFVFGRRIDAGGHLVDTDRVQLAGPSASDPTVASDGDRFLVAWTAGSICLRVYCPISTPLNLSGRVFDGNLQPASSEFVISEEGTTNEMDASVASSGDGWLVTWSAERTLWDPERFLFATIADAGYAFVSAASFVGAAHRPVPELEALRRDTTVAWTGTHYLLVSKQQGRLIGARVAENGVRIDDQDVVIAEDGSEPALAGSLLVYQRIAVERGLGAAPQLFMRELIEPSAPRRRAVSR